MTLHNLVISAPPRDAGSGMLSMEATARTYRYLDKSEIQSQKKPAAKGAP